MKFIVLLALVPLVALAAPVNEEVYARFDGEKVIRFSAKSEAQIAVIKTLRTNMTVPLGLDWWLEPSYQVGRHMDVRVPVAAMPTVSKMLVDAGIMFTVMIEDVQSLVEAQMQGVSKGANIINATSGFEFDVYHPLDEIQTWIQTLPRDFPDLCTLFVVGTSYQGNTIYGVKITSNVGGANKPGFWIDGGIHAREWISPATVLYMANELVTQYGSDPDVTSLLNELEIFVVPVFNVDGYLFTYSGNRMWRKTRRPNPGTTCIGTDPNRNFDDHWGEIGASPNPCDETFYGTTPFSEIEVKSVADYLTANPSIVAYFNIHSYSQLWLSPWGWTAAYPPDATTQIDLSRQATTALTAVYGTQYTFGPSYTTIYPTSGGSNDWTYDILGIVHSYVVELRDTGRYGFLLPADQIVPSGIETFAGMKVAMKYVLAADPATLRRKTA